MSKRVEVHQRLRAVASRTANKLGIVFTPACSELLEFTINNGVTRLDNQRVLGRQEFMVVTEDTLQKLVKELAEYAGAGDGAMQVDEHALERLMKKRCPLWPFC